MTPSFLLAIRNGFMALLLLPIGPVEAERGEVVILARTEVPVYRQFIERYRKACSCRPRVMNSTGVASELVQQVRAARPGVLLAVGRSSLKLARTQLTDLPTVYAMVVNPWTIQGEAGASRVGASLNLSPDHSLRLLRELSPSVQRVAIIYNPALTGPVVAQAQRAAAELGMRIQALQATDAKGATQAVEVALREADAVLMVPDRSVARPAVVEHLLLRALEQRVPVVGLAAKDVRRGALFSLSVGVEQLAVEAASLTEDLLVGRPPAQGGPDRRSPKLHLNLRTAARLGLDVPPALRARATQLVR